MEDSLTTAKRRSAEQEGTYRAGKKVANRELLKSFVAILLMLVLAVTVATVFAKGLNNEPKLDGVPDVIVTTCRQSTASGQLSEVRSICKMDALNCTNKLKLA